jgi:hypothetical protein
MYIPKRYGESKIARCPFCSQQAFSKNKEGVPVCADHKNSSLDGLKCLCGNFLEMREGKWGPFFICERCGTRNMTQAIEMNPQIKQKTVSQAKRADAYKDENGKDKYVRSDDPRFEFR